MTMTQERPAVVRRPAVISVRPTRRPDEIEPRRARSVALSELMGRRPDLHDVYTPATIAADAILWSA